MNKSYKNLIVGSFIVGLFIILITIIIQLNSKLNNQVNFSELDSILDNVIESGITTKSFNKEDPLLSNRQILITSTINENVANDVVSRLLYLESINTDSITIFISTNGGWGTCAKQIMETIQLIKSPVNVIATGTCYSSGSLILVSTTGKRYGTHNTLFMIHGNLYDPDKNGSDHRYYNQWYESIWKNRADLPNDWFPMVGDEAHYFNAEEAIKYKVIDEIIVKLK